MRLLCRVAYLLSALLVSGAPAQAFKTISEAEAYVSAMGTKEKISFDVQGLKEVLTSLVTRRESYGYTGRFVVKLTPYPSSKFVIWGPLKGALSSFVRTLSYLKKEKIISDNFSILTPRTYFVFDGDVVDGAPHVLETLSLVLSISMVNSNKVFYIKGNAEDELHWQNNGFKKALQTHASKLSSEKIPLGRLMTRFFDTLPLALFLGGRDPSDGLIRISYYPGGYKEIDEQGCGALLASRTVHIPELCQLSRPKKGPVMVKAIIKAEDRLISYRYHPGLTLVEPDRGATAWSIFSGLTTHYFEEYQFHYDAFSIITTGSSLKEDRITLYNRDSRESKDIKPVATYNVLTGQPVKETVDKKKAELTLAQMQEELRAFYERMENLMAQIEGIKKALREVKLPVQRKIS